MRPPARPLAVSRACSLPHISRQRIAFQGITATQRAMAAAIQAVRRRPQEQGRRYVRRRRSQPGLPRVCQRGRTRRQATPMGSQADVTAGRAPGFADAARSEPTTPAANLLTAQKCQDLLRRCIGLTEHRETFLLQHPSTRHVRRLCRRFASPPQRASARPAKNRPVSGHNPQNGESWHHRDHQDRQGLRQRYRRQLRRLLATSITGPDRAQVGRRSDAMILGSQRVAGSRFSRQDLVQPA